jgi:hypothetical protein
MSIKSPEKQAEKNAYSFFILPIASLLFVLPFLCITHACAMQRGANPRTNQDSMEQEQKEDRAQAPLTAPELPSFAIWCRQADVYSLNNPEEAMDPELADIEYTAHLHKMAQKACPKHYFEDFNTYVGARAAYGDGETDIDLERWAGQSTIELYKNFLEAEIARAQEQAASARAHHAKQARAHIALRVIPGQNTFELKLCNGDTWNSFQEKIAQKTGIPAEFLKLQIGGTGDPESLEDLIAWVQSGKCVLVIDSRKQS